MPATARITPARLRQPRKPQEKSRKRDRVGQGTAPVEARRSLLLPLRTTKEPEVQAKVEQSVAPRDQEEASPADVVDDDPAHDRSHGLAQIDDGHVDAHGSAPSFGRIGERDHGDGTGEHHRAAQALAGPEPDERKVRVGEHQGERAEREHRQSGKKDEPSAEEVGDLAEGDEKHGRSENVGQREPAEGHGAEVQLGLDRRQGDVDGGGHEGRHPHGHAVYEQHVGAVHGRRRAIAASRGAMGGFDSY